MITPQALEEVRGGVMGKLRRRRAAKRGVVACAVVACLVLLMPVKGTKAPPIAEPVLVSKAVAPVTIQSVTVQSATKVLPQRAAPTRKRVLPAKEIVKVGPAPAYIKILTDDPNVVFLLLNSEDGGTE